MFEHCDVLEDIVSARDILYSAVTNYLCGSSIHSGIGLRTETTLASILRLGRMNNRWNLLMVTHAKGTD